MKGAARNTGTALVALDVPQALDVANSPQSLHLWCAPALWSGVLPHSGHGGIPLRSSRDPRLAERPKQVQTAGKLRCNGTMTTGVRQPLLSGARSAASTTRNSVAPLTSWVRLVSGSWVRPRAYVHALSAPAFINPACHLLRLFLRSLKLYVTLSQKRPDLCDVRTSEARSKRYVSIARYA